MSILPGFDPGEQSSFFSQVISVFGGVVLPDYEDMSLEELWTLYHSGNTDAAGELARRFNPKSNNLSALEEATRVRPGQVDLLQCVASGSVQGEANGLSRSVNSSGVFSVAPGSDTPLCNTGCQSAELSEASQAGGIVVDWVQFTKQCLPTQITQEVTKLKEVLGDDWQDMERPFYGYGSGVRCGGVCILWNGHREDMGVHVQISGAGCRELEGRGLADWRGWFRDRFNEGVRFSRLDNALDDRIGLLNIQRMTDEFRAGRLVSRFNNFVPVQEYDGAGNLTAHGFNLGRREQDTSVCIYDKALEQREKLGRNKTVDAAAYAEKVKELGLDEPWVRLELRSRNDRADLLVGAIIREGFSAVAAVLRGYMEFKEAGTQTQKCRWAMASWWFEFIGWADKVRLTIAPLIKTLEQSMAWLDRQAGAVIGMVSEAIPDWQNWLSDVARRGSQRFGVRHKTMLQSYGSKAGVPCGSRAPATGNHKGAGLIAEGAA